MTVYYVDDGGSNTSPYDTWAKAAPTIAALDTAVTFASGDIVYIGHDSVDSGAGASLTIVGPTAEPPVSIISAVQGSSPPAYQKSATDQVYTGAGSYFLRLDGAFAFYGVRLRAGSNMLLASDLDESITFFESTLALGPNGSISDVLGSTGAVLQNVTIDLTDDGTTPRSGGVFELVTDKVFIDGLDFINAGYRTGYIFNASAAIGLNVANADFSGFVNATTCEILIVPNNTDTYFTNIKTPATWSPFTTNRPEGNAVTRFVNAGSAFSPVSLIERAHNAQLESTAAIYRTNGGAFEDVPSAWGVVTESKCNEGFPYGTPWMIGTVAAGSKTFTVYITNDAGDFTDAEVWLELEYLATSGNPIATIASDHRVITATPAAQTDDTTSTWNGTGPSFTYKQALSVTATVGQAGQYRARVVVGKASIASSDYFYIDPKVIVS